MDDGAHTIFLSTVGTNEDEVSPDLVRFLKYVGTPLSDSEKDFDDAFIQRIQSAVKEVKASREMGARYMTFQELLNDEREAGRKEGHAAGLKEGRIENLKNQVKKKLEKGKSVEAIAEDLEEDIPVIRELMEQLRQKMESERKLALTNFPLMCSDCLPVSAATSSIHGIKCFSRNLYKIPS